MKECVQVEKIRIQEKFIEIPVEKLVEKEIAVSCKGGRVDCWA